MSFILSWQSGEHILLHLRRAWEPLVSTRLLVYIPEQLALVWESDILSPSAHLFLLLASVT